MLTTSLGAPDVIQMQQVPDPIPGPGDLLIEVHASALNPIDTKLRKVSRPGLASPPFIGGYDVSGVVRAMGDQVKGFTIGQEVWASPAINRPGAHADLVCVDHLTAAPKPRTLSHEQAAALPLVTLTAWDALIERIKIRPGQTVLITAGGCGVGRVAIQLARNAGTTVYATAGSPDAIKLAESMGATVINYKEVDFAQEIINRTGGKGADVVLDCVGGETFEKCPDAVAVNGHLATIVPGPVPQSLTKLYPKNVTLYFEFMGAATVAQANPAYQGRVLREAATLVDAGKLRPHIFQTFALADVPKAHAQQETGRTVGKLVIKVR